MATEKKAKTSEAVEVTPAKAEKAAQESIYTATELADNYKVFGTFREIVVIALRKAGKETATLSEAKKIVDAFKNKEVKQ